MQVRAITVKITNLRVKRTPSMPKSPVLLGLESSATAPPKVPAGQMYLQNPGTGISCFTPYQSGIATTNTASTTYFSHDSALVNLFFLSLNVGILCKSSCRRPSGQSHPHIVRPSVTPKSRMIPIMYHPARCPVEASAFWSAPSGQAPIAPGQE